MRRRMLALLAATALAVTACASGGDDEATTAPESADGGMTEAEERGEAGTDAGGGALGIADDTEATAVSFGVPIGRKVIRQADLELAVQDADDAIRRITDVVERAGGFVASAELHNQEGYGLLGSLSLRVPTERMTSTLTSIEEVADEVRSRTLGSQDVTEQYADIESQLRNLRALETELLDLLTEIREKSSNANEVLTVFERIRQVRAEIEQLEGRKQVLDDLVSLATIDVRLVPSPSAVPIVEEDGWRFGEVLRDALRSTVTALQGVATVAIWLVVTALPVLLILGLPVLAIGLGYRRYRRRHDAVTPAAG
jgi:hypothetical protein